MTYGEAVKYILDIPKFSKKNSAEHTGFLLNSLGNPQDAVKVIHVAGTNGKGSVCAYLDAMLRSEGVRTGLFTSPHLVKINERIVIDGSPISDDAFVFIFDKVLSGVKKMEDRGMPHPTFFEFLFVMGLTAFAEAGADYVVLETGLGGRLDATNTVAHPLVSVITSIGMDHMEYLGDTKEKIAAEKAGIIKPHVPVVFWDEEPSVSRVIVEKAKKNGAETVPVSEQEVGFFNFKNKTVDFSMRSGYYEYIRVCLHTPAVYQRQNAALAVRALEVLNRKLTKEGSAAKRISREAIEEGLSAAHWSGRMEEVLPGVVIDGAHNEDGVSAFLESVQRDGCEGRRSLLFSVVSDKRAERMAEQILKSGLFSRIAAAPMESGRSVTKEQLDNIWKGRAELHDSPEEAFATLIGARGEKDMVYAAGSLYLAGQLLACGKND